MTTIINTGDETAVFRDDAGKHRLEPGGTLEVMGDQHLALLLSMDGIEVAPDPAPDVPRGNDAVPATAEELRAWLSEHGVSAPKRATLPELEALYLEAINEGGPDVEAGGRPDRAAQA